MIIVLRVRQKLSHTLASYLDVPMMPDLTVHVNGYVANPTCLNSTYHTSYNHICTRRMPKFVRWSHSHVAFVSLSSLRKHPLVDHPPNPPAKYIISNSNFIRAQGKYQQQTICIKIPEDTCCVAAILHNLHVCEVYWSLNDITSHI